ncbi:hypothetical protein PIB30_015579 [Stylosanthes scabra]|uniref:Uncharacterized protein n=1 Tax=Stylosanthes scabra TaxID=79078 RepID=A0ABU6Q731_9FABA|nr:hypothetical protein [Stylosanthes scabra]
MTTTAGASTATPSTMAMVEPWLEAAAIRGCVLLSFFRLSLSDLTSASFLPFCHYRRQQRLDVAVVELDGGRGTKHNGSITLSFSVSISHSLMAPATALPLASAITSLPPLLCFDRMI